LSKETSIPTALQGALSVPVAAPVRPHRSIISAFFGRLQSLPFILIHLAALLTVLFVPLTWTSAGLMLGFYFLRMFGITGVYHRYFAHRAYRTSRWFQFVLAWIGCMSLQKGPLWWASHHRDHHRYSDEEDDPHSPVIRTFWWSHVGWVLSGRYRGTDMDSIKDYSVFPELRLMDHMAVVPGLLLAGLCFAIDGMSGLCWGFIVGTVVLYHATFLVNSVCHIWGRRRFETTDQSRNNWWAALATMGEGWHNNHHHYQSCARQGFMWWEIDVSYYVIRTLALVGLVWDVREPTEKALNTNRLDQPAPGTVNGA
jgi:stearoyl-CoA desaturase (delta-9 desaturase)